MPKSKSKSSLKPYFHRHKLEAGCDEAGRGCLAGPVFAAAVILPHNFNHPKLDDSKKMLEKDRNLLKPIIEKKALAWSVQQMSPQIIDEINILNASIKAMHQAINSLHIKPTLLLIDGNYFKPVEGIEHQCVVQGDGKYRSIAAASVLAKWYRDDYMKRLHEKFPHFQWITNKGYGTRAHREAISKFGRTEFHRQSFQIHKPL